MTDDAASVDDWHRRFAVGLFNLSWTLLDKPDRSAQEDDDLVAAVFGSRFHWGQVGTVENTAIGDLHIARALAEVGYGAMAVHFATKGLATVEEEGWVDYRRASSYETMARALGAATDYEGRDEYLAKARVALDLIDNAEDRQLIEDQLRTVPGYRD